jgi:hypothetical protein
MKRALFLLLLVVAIACNGTTGSELVTFTAAAAGPSDAPGGALAFTSGRGFAVTLTKATLHVGALYLNQSQPVSGAQETSCVLPGTYVAEVTTGMTVDLLSPTLQVFPALGDGTSLAAIVGEVWLFDGDANAVEASVPSLVVEGSVVVGTETRAFRGSITIGSNRVVPTNDPSQPGAHPICKERIVSPIPVRVTPETDGSLVLRVDPRRFFDNVDFAALHEFSTDPPAYGFYDAPTDQPSINLYDALRSASGAYSFSWVTPALPFVPSVQPDAGTTDSGTDTGGGIALQPFTPPVDPGAGGVLFTASGEALALGGYAFPPSSPNAPVFVDGWEMKFDRVLVTLDKLTLSNDPDTAPGDESRTGTPVAEVDGPWAIDLHRDDPSYVPGKGGSGERAVPIASLASENLRADADFPTDGTRFAFGYDLVAASQSARNVNLDGAALADYAKMIADGCVVLYVGTATHKGTACAPDDPEFERLPEIVSFRLCFKSPTTYVNCQNPDNDPAKPFPTEEHQRGVAFKPNASVIAQVTVHTDHPFWENTLHDQPAHFDPFAARAVGVDAGTPLVTLEMMRGVDFTAFEDALGNPLPWRSCLATYTPPAMGTMSFNPEAVPTQPPSGDPSLGLRDYYDFTTYNQSTQGHLNSDGLCFVRRGYPSPR